MTKTLLLLGFLASVAVEGGAQAPAISAAFGAPRQLRYEVTDYSDPEGKRWIRVSGVFECLYAARMDDLIAKLMDYADSPKVFSRIEAVRVRSDSGNESVTEQRTAVRILGLAFVSNLVFANTLVRRGPATATLGFETIETDGSCLSTKGAWDFEDRSGPGGPSTYVRYSLESYVEPRFPGQASIMRGFGAGDLKKLMRELVLAMGRS
jgi:hypothetical protein